MVKVGRKEKTLCGGKLVVTNFRKLDRDFFNHLEDMQKKHIVKESVIFTPDGRIFVNNQGEFWNLFATIFEILMCEAKETLLEFQTVYKEKFPDIKDFDDWMERKWEAKEETDRASALFMLMVPIEFQRRDIERGYYGKMRKFPS